MSSRNPFSRPAKGGRYAGKDYTKYVRWTPLRMTLFTACISVPYFAVVIAVVRMTNPVVALLLIAPVVLMGLITGAMYWLSKANL